MKTYYIKDLFLTAAVARLLGWCSAALATVGVHLTWEQYSPERIATIILGVGGMFLHRYLSKKNLTTAIASTPATSTTVIVPK